jgi:hypothetical protein
MQSEAILAAPDKPANTDVVACCVCALWYCCRIEYVEAVGITLGVSMFSLSESTAKGDTAGKETQVHH